MSLVSSPYGAQPISSLGANIQPLRIPFGIASGLAAQIFKYQPVKINPANGTIVPCTNPGGTPDPIYGIFAGCSYSPLGGAQPTDSPVWPGGVTYDPSQDMFAYIWPMWLPDARIAIQADGPVAQALLGSSFNFTNLGAGTTQVGLSQCTVGAAGVPSGSQGQLTLMEFATGVNSTIGDAFTDLICAVSYPQVGWAGKTSIG